MVTDLHIGHIVSINGGVVDIRFDAALPEIGSRIITLRFDRV